MKSKYSQSFVGYLLSNKLTATQIILAGLFIVLCVIFFACGYRSGEEIKNIWSLKLDPAITLATLFTAIFVWINEKRQDYINALPKKMHVNYQLKGEQFARVTNAPLAGEDDIRQWGQSIAKTILNDNRNITFSGFDISYLGLTVNNTIDYEVVIYLTEPIPGIKPNSVIDFGENGNLKTAVTDFKL